jgi:hypothetical protein
MSRLSVLLGLTFLLSACVVEATPVPGSGTGTPDAGVGGPDGGGGGGGDGDGGGLGPDAAPTAASVLGDFGNCMRQTDWDAANLGTLALVQTNADGACTACHSAGENSTYLNADSTLTFTSSKVLPYVVRYAKVDALLALTLSNDLVANGQAAGHPPYTMPAALVQGLSDFYDATMVHYMANDCPPGL